MWWLQHATRQDAVDRVSRSDVRPRQQFGVPRGPPVWDKGWTVLSFGEETILITLAAAAESAGKRGTDHEEGQGNSFLQMSRATRGLFQETPASLLCYQQTVRGFVLLCRGIIVDFGSSCRMGVEKDQWLARALVGWEKTWQMVLL
ncbi:hypothetical protein EBH_0085380 [Eimeria brunetti]|uniref:Uncharacterized protein n=1 Tax=Eimeria brunetti TaxID=51314 RepID=U6LVS4_9EIME|nr:hypothetical protein EBH_0085380 [Eimeria brunetti]